MEKRPAWYWKEKYESVKNELNRKEESKGFWIAIGVLGWVCLLIEKCVR